MLNLVKKDFIFTKKIIFWTLLYCIVVPFVLKADNDNRTYFLDFLIPLALVTAPLAKIMNKEDTKSGIIFQKTLPYSSFEKVAARFAFVMSLLGLGMIYIGVVKKYLFHAGSLVTEIKESVPVFVGFLIYYLIYMTVYYWKGYFASQFCIYVLIVIVIFGRNLVNQDMIDFMNRISENKAGISLLTAGVVAAFYLLACFFEKNRRLDQQ